MPNVRMLTTIDNPFDPFTQYDEWYAYDIDHGYDTCGYLARIVVSSDDLSEEEESQAMEAGIQEILEYNILGIYKAVSRNTDIPE